MESGSRFGEFASSLHYQRRSPVQIYGLLTIRQAIELVESSLPDTLCCMSVQVTCHALCPDVLAMQGPRIGRCFLVGW